MGKKVRNYIEKYNRTGDEFYFEEIMNMMNPLVHAYARRLYYLEYEDCRQELHIAVYEAVKALRNTDSEYACLAYIKKAVVHKFCKLYYGSVKEKSMQDQRMNADVSENQLSYHDREMDNRITMCDLKKEMEGKKDIEKTVIYMLMMGYGDQEIADQLGYTRQYINRLKKNILK